MIRLTAIKVYSKSTPFFIQKQSTSNKPKLDHILMKIKYRQQIDCSKVPPIVDKDLKEEFVHGWGPGGQNVNKTKNCVLLHHIPSGIIIKCHETRVLQKNQQIARQRLQQKLDDFINGDQSVSAQIHKIEETRDEQNEVKAEKLRELKRKFKMLTTQKTMNEDQ